MGTFTPGPWRPAEHGVLAEKITSHGNWYVCSLIDPSNEEDKANARLIAAAPALYALIQDEVAAYPSGTSIGHGKSEWLRKARAALALADGDGAA